MTSVVELRDSKKKLPRPVTHFWHRVPDGLHVLQIRLAFLGLLGLALHRSVETSTGGDVLALLCGVLTAAVSATLGLVCDAGIGFQALFSDEASPVFRMGQRLSLCFGEPMSLFDICPGAGLFPTFSSHFTFALVACALFCGAEASAAGARRSLATAE